MPDETKLFFFSHMSDGPDISYFNTIKRPAGQRRSEEEEEDK
jgi:hypothetical protein